MNDHVTYIKHIHVCMCVLGGITAHDSSSGLACLSMLSLPDRPTAVDIITNGDLIVVIVAQYHQPMSPMVGDSAVWRYKTDVITLDPIQLPFD